MASNSEASQLLTPSFPTGRVKKIVKLDPDITRISSEALFLVSGAAELFLHSLAARSAAVAAEKKRKTVKLEHLRAAVKRHHPTRDFLFDSLPMPTPTSQPSDRAAQDRTGKRRADTPLPRNTRPIDAFFKKNQKEEGPSRANEADDLEPTDENVDDS